MIGEIRTHAMGVAIATAAGVDHHDLERIHSEKDMNSESFAKIQSFIFSISSFNPDVRYIYVMRRVQDADAAPWQYEYVVDQPAEDTNGNGIIDVDEATELPGTPYDASDFPFLIKAWEGPSADNEIAPDPPYPDLLSGYAPIKNERGETVAIVGADITAGTISKKLSSIKRSVFLVGVHLDITLTRRLLDNLISNAIKFSPENSKITVRVEPMHERQSGTDRAGIRIKVMDEGPGIDEEEKHTIFDRFHAVEKKPPFDSQIGLGLTLCKIVADAHGGRIFVQSNEPQGAIFTVEL